MEQNENVVVLKGLDDTQCTVNLHGCTITSWRVNNHEQLFVSRHSKFDHRKEIMGGIGLCFPKYGGWTFGPPNGFACISKWRLVVAPHKIEGSEDVEAMFELVDNPHTRSFWNFNFAIHNLITLRDTSLEIRTRIENTSPALPMRFNLMYPMFIQVPNVEAIRIVGMNKVQYRDETYASGEIRMDRKNAIEVHDMIYRIYRDAPNFVEIFHVVSNFSLKVRNEGLRDFMVWNPWLDGAKYVDDFRPEQYKEMICIGMGTLRKDICLQPMEYGNAHIKLDLNTGKGVCQLLY